MGAIVAPVSAERGSRDDPAFIDALDELPLWSAPFGLRLLEAVPLEPGATVLDVGCGTGFPLLELAHRLGPPARLVGLDPWTAALARAQAKRRAQDVAHVILVRGVAERLPLRDGVVDLVVSNNGLNNVQDLRQAPSPLPRGRQCSTRSAGGSTPRSDPARACVWRFPSPAGRRCGRPDPATVFPARPGRQNRIANPTVACTHQGSNSTVGSRSCTRARRACSSTLSDRSTTGSHSTVRFGK